MSETQNGEFISQLKKKRQAKIEQQLSTDLGYSSSLLEQQTDTIIGLK